MAKLINQKFHKMSFRYKQRYYTQYNKRKYVTGFNYFSDFHKQFQTKYFDQAYKSSNITGIYLADLLAEIFQDHFITLVGFSLGTQVILSALKQFKNNGKLHMINRVITMGGVANHKQIQQFLNSINQNQKKSYLFIGTMFIVKPIIYLNMHSNFIVYSANLLDQIKLIKTNNLQIKITKKQYLAFNIQNLDVTDIISGHLDYRDNLNKISKFLDLMHQ